MKEAEQIIADTRAMIDETHRNVTGHPASDDAVMLSLATQVYLARKALADERVGRLITASRTFVKDWRDGDFALPRLAEIHAEAIAEKIAAIDARQP